MWGATYRERVRRRSICWQNRNVSALADTLLKLPKRIVLVTHLVDPAKLGYGTVVNRSFNTQDWREGDITAIWCGKRWNHCI
jgi:hypothetical protein